MEWAGEQYAEDRLGDRNPESQFHVLRPLMACRVLILAQGALNQLIMFGLLISSRYCAHNSTMLPGLSNSESIRCEQVGSPNGSEGEPQDPYVRLRTLCCV
jgi:hypothetical protein